MSSGPCLALSFKFFGGGWGKGSVVMAFYFYSFAFSENSHILILLFDGILAIAVCRESRNETFPYATVNWHWYFSYP